MNYRKSPGHQKGISLVEILISLIVTGVGLLGVAAMQSISIKMSFDSYLRSQVTFLYYDITDRMRANPSADYTLLSSTSFSTAPSPVCNTSSSSCDTDELKDHDLYFWWLSVQRVLPNPSLSITPPNGTEQLTKIVIEWGNQVDQDFVSETNGGVTVEKDVKQKLEFLVEI